MTLMKPKKTNEVPKGTDYVYEIKYDGGSSKIKVEKGKVEIQHGDNPDSQTYKYPEIIDDLSSLGDGTYIAELCVIDPEHIGGHFPNFLRRQCQEHFKIKSRSKSLPVTVLLHDIIESYGKNIKNDPLMKRKEILEKSVKESSRVQLVRFYDSPEPILKLRGKVEGCIAKRKDSEYRMDSRDGWYKQRYNKRKVVTFTKYENWHKDETDSSGSYTITGIVLSTPEGKRATLAGPRQHEAKEKINKNGKVDILLEFHEETDEGFRFPVVVEVL